MHPVEVPDWKLNHHLETSGHAGLNTGLRRSDPIPPGLLEAKRNFAIGKKH